jgi:hypothetical protein
MLCGLMEFNLHLQSQRVNQSWNYHEEGSKQYSLPCLAYSLSMKTEAVFSSEMSVDFHWTTWCCIPEGRNHHSHNCESPKSLFRLCTIWCLSRNHLSLFLKHVTSGHCWRGIWSGKICCSNVWTINIHVYFL